MIMNTIMITIMITMMAMSTNTTAGATTAAMLICIMSQSAQSAVGTASTLIKVNPALENKACATEL